jgi:hypothetical protein
MVGHERPREVRCFMRTSLGFLVVGVMACGLLFMGGFLVRLIAPGALLASAETPASTVTVRGKLVCLPHRAGHPQTFECIIGLLGTDGQYYALKNLDQEAFATGKMTLGQQLQVTGRFMPDPMEPYDTAGTIEVHSTVQSNRFDLR